MQIHYCSSHNRCPNLWISASSHRFMWHSKVQMFSRISAKFWAMKQTTTMCRCHNFVCIAILLFLHKFYRTVFGKCFSFLFSCKIYFVLADHLKVQQQKALRNSSIFSNVSLASANLSVDIGDELPAHHTQQTNSSVQQQHTGLYLIELNWIEWWLANLHGFCSGGLSIATLSLD